MDVMMGADLPTSRAPAGRRVQSTTEHLYGQMRQWKNTPNREGPGYVMLQLEKNGFALLAGERDL